MGITDGTFVCSLCGEWLTGCSLCGEAPLIDMRSEIERKAREDRENEAELARQSMSISQANQIRWRSR